MSKHTELGKNGEILAVDFLEKQGYIIVCTNFRSSHKEIDIIATDNDVIVFVEVKTRSNFNFGYPEEAVTERKQNLLKSAANDYLQQYDSLQKIRFDIISILYRQHNKHEIAHIIDAFY